MIKQMVQARQEKQLIKELRKLKKMQIIEEYENTNSKSIVNNSAVVNMTLLSLGFSAVVGLADLSTGIAFGAGTLALTTGAIFLEAFIQSTFESISEFIHMNFTTDRERRRAYKQTKKVIKYAINKDRLSDDQISLMIEGLINNAKNEQQQQKNFSIDFSKVYSNNNAVTKPKEVKELKEVKEIPVVSEAPEIKTNQNTKYDLVFKDESIDIMLNGNPIETVSYEEIQQAETEEEIASMPYSTIYGYVVRDNKTIYIDMEQEVALIK